jgi:hypothetical protein
MWKSIFLLMPLASSGFWVNTDGTIVEMICPSIEEYQDRARLPSGCEVEVAGVWLSTAKYRSLEVDLAVAKAELKEQQELIDALKLALRKSEGKFLICKAAPPCEPPFFIYKGN